MHNYLLLLCVVLGEIERASPSCSCTYAHSSVFPFSATFCLRFSGAHFGLLFSRPQVEYDLFLFSDIFSCEQGQGGCETESFLTRGELGEKFSSSFDAVSRRLLREPEGLTWRRS